MIMVQYDGNRLMLRGSSLRLKSLFYHKIAILRPNFPTPLNEPENGKKNNFRGMKINLALIMLHITTFGTLYSPQKSV